MKHLITAFMLAATLAMTANAQQYAANSNYRICAPAATQQGI